MGFIAPADKALSLKARGLLALMLNDIHSDYCARESLYNAFPTEDCKTVDEAIEELCERKYIIEFEPNRYAVNKIRIPEMSVIMGGKI